LKEEIFNYSSSDITIYQYNEVLLNKANGYYKTNKVRAMYC